MGVCIWGPGDEKPDRVSETYLLHAKQNGRERSLPFLRTDSIPGIAVNRSNDAKWLFPQERATLNAIKKSACIPKML
jgi:hypothetical protein